GRCSKPAELNARAFYLKSDAKVYTFFVISKHWLHFYFKRNRRRITANAAVGMVLLQPQLSASKGRLYG
ncbi:hypothetical protein, partial [Hoylesella saccharolytica]|uniref:hypothetical protein n=1 Tax=Hoylesella saccharolytica TaxID=633701 RepID=UPI001E585E61